MPNTLCLDRVAGAAISSPAVPGKSPGAAVRHRRRRRRLLTALVLTASAALGAYLTCRSLLAGAERHSDTRPAPLPAAALSPGNQKILYRRVGAFRAALKTRRAGSRLPL